MGEGLFMYVRHQWQESLSFSPTWAHLNRVGQRAVATPMFIVASTTATSNLVEEAAIL